MINLYHKYRESGLTTGEIHKERQTHAAPTELEVVRDAVRYLKALQAKLGKLELAALAAEEKTGVMSEIDQFSAELEARLNKILSRLQPRKLA